MRYRKSGVIFVFSFFALSIVQAQDRDRQKSLKLGDKAKDVELQLLTDKKVKLSQLTKDGPVVVVVLRGYPGYQCPICTQQVGELRKHASDFKRLNAKVALIYPGTAEKLKQRAEEFLTGTKLPDPLMLVIDAGFRFTTLYGLRWESPGETAYPSTFVLDHLRVVKFRKVSKSHGDRAQVEDVLEVLEALKVADSATGREIPQDRGSAPQLKR